MAGLRRIGRSVTPACYCRSLRQARWMLSDRLHQPAEACADLLIDSRHFRFDVPRVLRNLFDQLANLLFLLFQKCAVRSAGREQ